MTRGYLLSAKKVFFSVDPHNDFFLTTPQKDDIVLTEHNWIGPKADAWCCPDCQQILVQYGKQG